MADNKKIILGTRGSKLALWQASYISGLLRKKAQIETEIKIIKTKGDKILDVSLAKIGDKGLFVKEIENELLSSKIDIAVHSMKDLPTEIPNGLVIAASPKREDYRDAFISLNFKNIADLNKGAVVGSSSLRRRAQILASRNDLEVKDIRGNVDTRIKKLEQGDYQAIIMAKAGLKRLGLTKHIKQIFSEDEMLPAVGQGAIAIEARENDKTTLTALEAINDQKTLKEVAAERALMKRLEGGCQVPIGAVAVIKDDALHLKALVSSLKGDKVLRADLSGSADSAEQIGLNLAEELLAMGAGEILEKIRKEDSGCK